MKGRDNVKRLLLSVVLALPLTALPVRALAAPDNSHTLFPVLYCDSGQVLYPTFNSGFLFHSADSTSNYLINYITSPQTGVLHDSNGLDNSGQPTLTCYYTGPTSGNDYTVVLVQTPNG